jgi:AmpD protein
MRAEYRIDDEGIADAVCWTPSPNFDDRPAGTTVELLVVHAISLPPGVFGGSAVCEFFTNCLDPDADPYYRDIACLRVSAHFYVSRDGEMTQFVSCAKRAWHAGVSSWRGRDRCNDFSIGIELEGCDEQPFEGDQYEALAGLTWALRARYPIADVVGHSDISPGRKTDPGPFFDWPRYRKLAGI